MKNIINFFVSLGFCGYIKKGPGTIATMLSILIIFPIIQYELIGLNILILLLIFLIVIALFFIESFSKKTQSHDSKIIVIDEFIGIYFIFLFYNEIFIFNHFLTILLIFILFRFFDILKIFPANIVDKKMINSFGVIFDDIIAAIYTIGILFFVNEIFK